MSDYVYHIFSLLVRYLAVTVYTDTFECLMLSTLGKFSADDIWKYFSQQTGFDISCKVLHEMSNPVFRKKIIKKRKISNCPLLN